MDGAVGLEPMETGEDTKECGGLSEWEPPGDNANLHRLASIVPGMGREKFSFHPDGGVLSAAVVAASSRVSCVLADCSTSVAEIPTRPPVSS